MADVPPRSLWRDSRNNRIYRVSAGGNDKVNMGTLAGRPAVEKEVAALNLANPGWGTIRSANDADWHDWLDSIPTVV